MYRFNRLCACFVVSGTLVVVSSAKLVKYFLKNVNILLQIAATGANLAVSPF
jgi:hypothetical protein